MDLLQQLDDLTKKLQDVSHSYEQMHKQNKYLSLIADASIRIIQQLAQQAADSYNEPDPVTSKQMLAKALDTTEQQLHNLKSQTYDTFKSLKFQEPKTSTD